MIGQKFQEWTIEKQIGEGAFGDVYKITREEFGHTYEAALKVIDIPRSQAEVKTFRNEGMSEENVTTYFQSVVERIVEEFVLMSKLKGNSNIVSYEDHAVEKKDDEFGWRIYIRMELLTPLFKYVKEKGFDERDVIKLGIDICKGLELCSKNNIIHRDIKPENIFISPAGDFKLGDFGIARELEKTSASLSKAGTKNYMAPEVYKGFKYNSTVDIYSLGIVLYRFLNDNRLPFMPPAPNEIKFSDQQKAFSMRFSGQPMSKPSKASDELAIIVLKACSYFPIDRYQTAIDMRRALEKLKVDDVTEKKIKPYAVEDVISKGTAEEKEIIVQDMEDDYEGTRMLFEERKKAAVQIAHDNCIKEEITAEKNDEIAKEDKKTEIDSRKKIKKQQKELERRKKYIFAVIGGVVIICLAFTAANMIIRDNNSKEKYLLTNNVSSENVLKTAAPVAFVNVPKFKNMTTYKLEKKAKEYGLVVEYGEKKYSSLIKKGCVVSQSPKADTRVEIGTRITVNISKGIEKVCVPTLIGVPLDKAKSKIKEQSLKCSIKKQYNSLVEKGIVYKQSVKAKSKVKKGSKITIYVSKGEQPVKVTPRPSYVIQHPYSEQKQPVVTKKSAEPAVPKSDGTFKGGGSDEADGTFR